MSNDKLNDIFDNLNFVETKPEISKIDGDTIIITCPGFDQDDIYAGVDDNILTIEGESMEFGSFNEKYKISRNVIGVEISLKCGILTAILIQKQSNVEITFK